jgi:1,6-anhydro-N-acetylmuramate kinase
VIDTSSSAWRTAYISTLFEKDVAKLAVRIVEASVAINERLNSLVEIGATEHQALEVARQALRSLKAQRVDAIVGETLEP